MGLNRIRAGTGGVILAVAALVLLFCVGKRLFAASDPYEPLQLYDGAWDVKMSSENASSHSEISASIKTPPATTLTV